MVTVSIPGGSQPEILELVKKYNEVSNTDVNFLIFDTKENIANKDLQNWNYTRCSDKSEMIRKAVEAVSMKKADILLKGIVSTHDLLKEVLNKKHHLKKRKTLSHVSIAKVPNFDRQFLITDAAMNISPNTEQLEDIIKNSVEVAHNIGIEKPKVALLSAAENFNEKMPSSVLGKELTDIFENDNASIVFGPLSLDLAMSKSAVEHKRFEGPIMGDADVLVVPSIDVGNILYKSLIVFANSTMGGIIVGTTVPIVLTSRSDSVESKLFALNLALQQVN